MNWLLVTLLVVVALPGILWVVPRSLRNFLETAADRQEADRELPSFRVLVLVSIVQSTVLVAVAAAVGAYTAPAAGLEAPFFEALVTRRGIWPALAPQLVPAVALSVFGSAIFLVAYYGLFRPRLDAKTVAVMEGLRLDLGILGRVLYGGVAEEILARWGLMSLLAWVGVLVVGTPTPAVAWTAIVVAGVLFGLGHLPSYLAAGGRRTPLFIATMLSLNLWASLLFGWLFWQYGLAAAILSHALFHCFWLPFDVHFAQE